jgi:hypothetical protein
MRVMPRRRRKRREGKRKNERGVVAVAIESLQFIFIAVNVIAARFHRHDGDTKDVR